MNRFICKGCQNEWVNLGDSLSSCPVCGLMNHAMNLPRTQWICVKCKTAFSTESASGYSKCPKCGHQNKGFNQ